MATFFKTLGYSIVFTIATFVALIALAFSNMPSVAQAPTNFITAVVSGDTQFANQQLSPSFLKGTPPDQLEKFLTENRFSEIVDFDFSGFHTVNSEGTVSGQVTLSDNSVLPILFDVSKQDEAWKIDAVRLGPSVAQPDELAIRPPTTETLVELVQVSGTDLARLLRSGDTHTFHKSISLLWQDDMSPEEISAALGSLIEKNMDLVWLTEAQPEFTTPAFVNDGVLKVEGQQSVQGSVYHFTYTYCYEGVAWKLMSFDFNLKPV